MRLRGRRRGLRVASTCVVGLVVAVGLVAGALSALLASGPMRVDWLGRRIAASLQERTGQRYGFEFGATYVARSVHGLTLAVEDFNVRSGDQTIVAAPHAEVAVDLLALLTGSVRPRRLSVSNIDINLVALPDGSLSIAGGQNAAPIAVAPAVPVAEGQRPRAALLTQAGAALRGVFDMATDSAGATGLVERVGVTSGRLIVEDRSAERTTTFDALELEFDRTRGRADLLVRARGPNGPLSAFAHASVGRDGARQLRAGVKDVSIDELNLAAGVRRPPLDSDAKLAATFSATLDAAGGVREARAAFGVGPGFVRLEDPDHEPYFIDEASGGAHWDAASRRIVVDPTHLFAGETRLTLTGAAEPPARGEDAWRVRLGLAEPGALSPERPGEAILRLNELVVDAAVSPQARRATVAQASIKGPEIDVAFSGAADWTQGLRVAFTGEAGQGPARALLRVWPSQMAASVRGWLIGHVHGGVIRSAKMRADYDAHALLMLRYGLPPPDKTLSIDVAVAGGSIDTLAGLPPTTGLDATVKVTGRTTRVDARAGQLELSPGRRLTLQEGSLVMPRNDGGGAVPAHLSIRAGGPADAVADILSRDAFRATVQSPFDPAAIRGKVDGKVDVDFEIGPEAQAARTAVEAAVNASDLSIERLVGKERLEGANAAVVVDAGGVRINGAGRIFGGPATFDLRKPAGQPMVAAAGLTIDEAARAKAGFAAPGVTGPIVVRVNATIGEATRAQVELDLTRTGLENGLPGLVKPAGKPAKLSFVADQRNAGLVLDQLVFDGGGAQARGVVELGADGAFQSARFSQIRLSAGDDIKAEIQKGPDGVRIVARASAFDARPFLKTFTQPGAASGSGADFDLDLKAPIVTGFGKQVLSNVDLKLSRKGSVIRQFTMNGGFGRRPVAIAMARGENNMPQVNIATPDAGALLAFTDLYPRMEGGTLAAIMQLEPGRVTGTVKVAKFTLKDEPALRRLVVEGVPQQPGGKPAPTLDANQIAFDRLQVVFTHAGGRLDIRDGLMNGPALGLTVEGSIDDARDALNLSGAYVPAYGINNLFSKIPVVGLFLGGGWNEGLFAVNYHITGRPSAPVLSINPLSAVAPGFLRKVFGAIDGTAQPSHGEGAARGARRQLADPAGGGE